MTQIVVNRPKKREQPKAWVAQIIGSTPPTGWPGASCRAFAALSGNSRRLVTDLAADRRIEAPGYITQLMAIPDEDLNLLRKHPLRHVSSAEFKCRFGVRLPASI
jgi:hypothetical protein